METISIRYGKYKFKASITDEKYEGNRYLYNIKFGGDYAGCVNISFKFDRDGNALSASIPHVLYEPECSIGSDLEKGGGSIEMLKCALLFANSKFPKITTFHFDDMSHIDCIEKNLSIPHERKLQKPLSLLYFSIAYHDKSWYELHFNARLLNDNQYSKYRESITFLKDKTKKLPFSDFLRASLLPKRLIDYIKPIYESTETYRDFFLAIPKEERCDILFSWLPGFMEYYGLSNINNKWVIDINNIQYIKPLQVGGKHRKTLKKREYKKEMYRIVSYQNIMGL